MATMQTFQGKRLSYKTATPFNVVVDRLRRQLHPQGLPISESPLPQVYADVDRRFDRATFSQFWQDRTGASGFTYFFETEYGQWLPLFGIDHGHKAKRFIIGNPLIAAGIIKHDLNACLAVPVELLLRETDSGFVEVIYNLPSSLIVSEENAQNAQLRDAVAGLDGKLADLVKMVTEP